MKMIMNMTMKMKMKMKMKLRNNPQALHLLALPSSNNCHTKSNRRNSHPLPHNHHNQSICILSPAPILI